MLAELKRVQSEELQRLEALVKQERDQRLEQETKQNQSRELRREQKRVERSLLIQEAVKSAAAQGQLAAKLEEEKSQQAKAAPGDTVESDNGDADDDGELFIRGNIS